MSRSATKTRAHKTTKPKELWVPIGTGDPGRGKRKPDPHVFEAQHLLVHNRFGNFRPGPEDGITDALFFAAVRHAKHDIGYPPSAISDIFGARLHEFLTGARPLPPSYLKRRKTLAAAAGSEKTIRGNVEKWCNALIAVEPQVHYAPVRPMPLPPAPRIPIPRSFSITTDCSGSATWIVDISGGEDPNGFGFNGSGFTGSMAGHMRPIHASDVQVADFGIIFDPSGVTHHVIIALEAGSDPNTFSHGQESGPIRIRASAELASQTRSHGRGTTLRWFSLTVPAH
jgi:hypothetical protein